MGIKVGLPIMKLSKKGGTGKTGKLRAVAGEALSERWGKDPAIDKSRTIDNEYVGITSAVALDRAIDEECKEYNKKRKANGERSLRDDAVLGFALIVKPPSEWISGLSVAERKKFFEDSDEIIRDIMGGYTDSDGAFHSNIRSEVLHRDEVNNINGEEVIGEHKHYFGMPYTADGRICAKELINLKLFNRFNAEYPKRMQAKGWSEIDEPDVYDVARGKQDAEYREAHIAKRQKQGLESRTYKADKRVEEAKKRAESAEKRADTADVRTEIAEERIRELEAQLKTSQAPAVQTPTTTTGFVSEIDVSKVMNDYHNRYGRNTLTPSNQNTSESDRVFDK
jgi:hypothetical protein